jgi:phage terminase large subunit-like protein
VSAQSTNSSKRGSKEIKGWPPRHLSPLTPNEMKKSRGDNIIDFSEALCSITKDSVAGAAGEPLIFRGWQKQLTKGLFAEKADGSLKHKVGLIGLPRKNGKSAWLSALALEHLVLGPNGGETYSCAAEKEQAKIVFGTAKRMVEMQPELSEILDVYRDAIYNPKTGSVYRALSAEAFSKEGLSPTFIAFDELHAQPNRELWDVMSLAMGARREPLMVAITTAGVKSDSTGKDSICYQLYEYGKRVASGEVVDPTFFFAWWEANPDLDYREIEAWEQSNPGFGDIVAKDDFASAILRTPESEFKTKRLNVWTSTSDTWLPHGAWDACYTDRRIEPGTKVVLGFDGSFNGDCTVVVAVTCEEVPHIVPLNVWEKPEEAGADWQVPILDVEEAVRQACRNYEVAEIACDPYRWARTFQVLEEEGLPVVVFPQTASRMTPATTRFYEAVVNKSVTHEGDPTMARHVGNATLRIDQRGTRLAKEKPGSTRRIDLAVSAVMALERAVWWFSQGNFLPAVFDLMSIGEQNENQDFAGFDN